MSFNICTHHEVVNASESLYQAQCVAYILKGLGDDSDDINYMHLNDLGALLIRLLDSPLTILHELRTAAGHNDPDPDPGRHEPVLVSIGDKQIDAGGAK